MAPEDHDKSDEANAAPPIPAGVALPASLGATRPNDGPLDEWGGSGLGEYQGGGNECD